MGIDAEMLVKWRGTPFTQEQTLRLSWELCSTIGYEHFGICKAKDHIHSNGHHAIELLPPHSKEAGDWCYEPEYEGKQVFFQDGDPIVAEPGEQFLRIHLWSRYYGKSYERGNWPIIRQTIEWCWARLPSCEVWYGGDNSGVTAELMTQEWVTDLNRHFLVEGHRPYVGGFSAVFGSESKDPICPCCKVPMVSNGGGGNRTFWYCDGCGNKALRDPTRVKFFPPKTDSFSMTFDEEPHS